MKLHSSRTYLILQHVLFVIALIAIGYFFDPRPDFVKENDGWEPQYHFLRIIIVLLFCYYINMFFLVPNVLTKFGWIAYLITVLVVSGIMIFAVISLMEIGENLSRPVAPQVFMFVLLIAFSVSTSVRLNSDRIKNDRKRKEQETEMLKSELSLLRSQITPHFMFNVLNTLTSLARQKSDDLEDVIIQISHLMRYMLYGNSDNKITLDKEIEFLNSYVEIQKLRFGDLDITTNIDVANPEIRIVPMLLIPLLENAFKHGAGAVQEPQIKVEFVQSELLLTFEVSNRFNPEFERKTEASGIGLQNVQKRLKHLYEDRHELTITKEGNFFTAKLTLTF